MLSYVSQSPITTMDRLDDSLTTRLSRFNVSRNWQANLNAINVSHVPSNDNCFSDNQIQ